MNNRLVRCDNCNEMIKIKPKKQKRGVNTEINYFTCPNCKNKYVFSVTNQECRKLQREIKELQRNKNKCGTQLAKYDITNDEYVEKIDRINDDIKDKQELLKIKTDELIRLHT